MSARKRVDALAVLAKTDDHLQQLKHYAHSHDLRQAMAALTEVVEEAQRCVSSTGDLKDLRTALVRAGGDV